MTITNYMSIGARLRIDLNAQAQRMIENGWRPAGGVNYSFHPENGTHYNQAFIKEEEKKKPKPKKFIYDVLRTKNREEMIETINVTAKNGWEPVGNTNYSYHSPAYIQLIRKEVEIEDEENN